MNRARLALASGRVFEGEAVGSPGTVRGEVVFNTAMSGYQEILSDPSYAGQLICFTYPEIGNTGVTPEDDEAPQAAAEGLIVRALQVRGSNWRARGELPDWLQRQGLQGISGVDTRALVRHLRSAGAQMGVLDSTGLGAEALLAQARALRGLEGQDLVAGLPALTTARQAQRAGAAPTEALAASAPRILLLDCGAKQGIVDHLEALGAQVFGLKAPASAAAILALKPDGLLLSNGPGDPAALEALIATVRELLGVLPIFGICLGCQILGLALGAKTRKLPFGHHGANHPVLACASGRVEITSHNHGFALDAEGLPEGVLASHRSLYDGTVEGIEAPALRAFGVQFHPEASPGPHDAAHLFGRFLSRVSMATKEPFR